MRFISGLGNSEKPYSNSEKRFLGEVTTSERQQCSSEMQLLSDLGGSGRQDTTLRIDSFPSSVTLGPHNRTEKTDKTAAMLRNASSNCAINAILVHC